MEVVVPDLGDFADVEIIDVLVKPGDVVKAEQGLVTLETEKATIDVPSPAAGQIIAFTRRDGAFVFPASGVFEDPVRNDLGDASVFNASPALSRGQIFIRSNEYLYCIGEKAK